MAIKMHPIIFDIEYFFRDKGKSDFVSRGVNDDVKRHFAAIDKYHFITGQCLNIGFDFDATVPDVGQKFLI